MDIEFHYYIMYLIAAKAGFNPEDSYLIAYSSQFVDDNVINYEINSNTSQAYENHISQTYNILKPTQKLFSIYPQFHFIPGDIESDIRKDGKLHYLNTTPGSINAEEMLKSALESNNLYRIGIACHGYADTWSHQNFVGYLEEFNADLKHPLKRIIPFFRYKWGWRLVGHAAFDHKPDKVNGVWLDQRLIPEYEQRHNNTLFLEAASSIFDLLYFYNYPDSTTKEKEANIESLLNDLSYAFNSESPQKRIENYIELSKMDHYGSTEIKKYDRNEWMEEAIHEDLQSLRTKGKHIVIKVLYNWLSSSISLLNQYNWKDSNKYMDTNWFKFQEAIKKHQEVATDILNQTDVGKLKLADW